MKKEISPKAQMKKYPGAYSTVSNEYVEVELVGVSFNLHITKSSIMAAERSIKRGFVPTYLKAI
ncbi:hypothetical protein D6783_05450, partial [Candidatus Woesearchaeota archaeon]